MSLAIDLVVLLVLFYFAWHGYTSGFVGGILNLLTTIASFLLAGIFYPYLADFVTHGSKLSANLSSVLSFFVILLLSEAILTLVVGSIYKNLVLPIRKRSRTLRKIDKLLGILPSTLVGVVLVSLFLLLFLVLPINQSLQEATRGSWWGRNVLVKALALEPEFEKYFGRLPYQNLLYFLTPNPEGEEAIKLSIPKDAVFKIDLAAEKKMLDLVNQERVKIGLKKVKPDQELTETGRAHCQDMFKRSYFSHYSPEGKSPFDRMHERRISYTFAGENLAYAANVELAHQGLMNSKGHRENILRKEFGHLGVGVIDAGFSGKMFCQEFTN